MRNSIVRLGQGLLRQTPIAAPARSFGSVSAPALSSRGRTYVKQQQQPARTGLKDLHPLPESMREQLESDGAPQEPYTASGNSNDPAVHSSRPAAQPAGVDVDPSVAAPGLVNGSSGNGSNGSSSSSATTSAPSSNVSEEWGTSFAGLGERSFSKEAVDVLMGPINESDIEIKPDGLIYLPEIKYRRILNRAFGPGGWGMAPRSETNVGQGIVSREWVLICQGRFVATARGEQEFFKPSGVPTAAALACFGVDECMFAGAVRIDRETMERVANIERKYASTDASTGLSPAFEAVGVSTKTKTKGPSGGNNHTLPKMFADVFEALVAAVFLDSGRDLQLVRDVFMGPLLATVGQAAYEYVCRESGLTMDNGSDETMEDLIISSDEED